MKRIARNLVVLAVFAMALTGLSMAQQFAYRVSANIPYGFYVGDQQLSAGNYIFTVNYGDHAVTMTNQSNGHSSVVLAAPIAYASPGYDNRDKATVVELASVRGQYVLADIKTRSSGVSFAASSSDRKLAENGGIVTIIASLR